MLSILLLLLNFQFTFAQEHFDPNQCNQMQYEVYFLDGGSGGCCPGYTEERTQSGQRSCRRGGATVQAQSQVSPQGGISQIDNLVKQCADATEEARKDCNFDGNPTVRTALAMASGIKAQLNQGAAASQAALCSQMGSLAQAIDAATAAYSGYCSTGFAKCSDTCDSSLQEAKSLREVAARNSTGFTQFQGQVEVDSIDLKIKDLRTYQRQCGALASNIQNVQENIASYAQLEKLKSQSCGKQVGGGVDAACQANPFSPACQQKLDSMDCSNPEVARTNRVCICRNNPGACAGGTASFASGGSNSGSGNGSGGTDGSLSSFGGLGGDLSGGAGFDPNSRGGHQAENGSLNKGAGGRAHLDVGNGGGAGGGPGGRGGAAGSGANTKIIGGYGFGSGGSGGFGSYGSGNPDPNQKGNYGRGGVGPNGKPVDLRQFMPGGRMDPSRALAGVSGPDGITGPNSDIWQKIRVRYFSVSSSLLP